MFSYKAIRRHANASGRNVLAYAIAAMIRFVLATREETGVPKRSA